MRVLNASTDRFPLPSLGLPLIALLMFAFMLLVSPPVTAGDDGCFRLPNGTKFCAKPPSRDKNPPDVGRKKPAREVAPDRRERSPQPGKGAKRNRAIKAAGGHAFLVEQFDARSIPSLEVVGPCLCRDGTEPVYGFCTEGNQTYKLACAR